MVVVDVEYDVYKCPHCSGFVIVRKQFPHFGEGCSVSVEHLDDLPDYLASEEVLAFEIEGKK